MRPHMRRIIPSLRPFRPPNRLFTQIPISRPQLPFLAQSQSRRRAPIQARFLTTERKQWIRSEIFRAGKYTVVLWTSATLLFIIAFGVQQEYMERQFPSPHEWSWVSRKNFRSARFDEQPGTDDSGPVDWARSSQSYSDLLRRLEDPSIDGADLKEQDEGGILVAGIGRTGYDITKKPEPWRRGYCDVLMGAARAAEHLDGWVRDKTRNVAFPANVVIGPSNPDPRPVPPGAKSPPREEDCEPAFDPPEKYYMRILTTHGFTEKQKLDAALAYAAWLDFKGTPESALEMYKWGLDIASASVPNAKAVVHRDTLTINPSAGPVSSNILTATTALAVHHAQHGRISTALPIFLSVLRARRSLPPDVPTMRSTLIPDPEEDTPGIFSIILSLLRSLIVAPKYPRAPSDGTQPPSRDSKSRCEEAGLMTYIGEILYASNTSTAGREEGLAWTREGVDIAEEELRGKGVTKDTKKTCSECLETGLGNWSKMVARLAKEEKEKKDGAAAKVGGWLLGYGGENAPQVVGRWETEERVVQERTRRAMEVLENSVKGSSAGQFMLT